MAFANHQYYNPSDALKELWTLVPQVTTLEVDNLKTRGLFSAVSSTVPVFYLLMIMAISFDIYLGFFILSKQGVSMGIVVGSVIADLFLGVLPFLIEGIFFKNLNHTRVENSIFRRELEARCKMKGETQEAFNARSARIKNGLLKKLRRDALKSKVYRFVIILIIFAIAFWKIYTFMSVLPPSISIWMVVKGKIIIIFSLLTALFHIIGTEKAVAHLFYYFTKKSDQNEFINTDTGVVPAPLQVEIEYEGKFNEARKGNTAIVKNGETPYLEFLNFIGDGEIQALINSQTDPVAKRVVAIKCKENQLI